MDKKNIEIKEIYQGTQENRQNEFKSGFIWKHPTAESLELIKTIISMFNTPSGGTIVYGIEQERNNSKIKYTGLSLEQIESFEKNEEIIKRVLNSYTTINISPHFLLIEDSVNKKTFLSITVPNYKEYPCLTNSDGVFTNKKGKKIYKFRIKDLLTRSISIPFSSEKVSQNELNEMIELCAKGLRTKCVEILNLKKSPNINTQIKIEDKLKKERKKIYGDLPN